MIMFDLIETIYVFFSYTKYIIDIRYANFMNKYMENIAFIGTFVLVVIFSYYLIYSNAIVRTKSNNVYWGKEYKSQYTDLK